MKINFKFTYKADGVSGHIVLTDLNIVGAMKQLERFARWNDLKNFKILDTTMVKGRYSKGKMRNVCFA